MNKDNQGKMGVLAMLMAAIASGHNKFGVTYGEKMKLVGIGGKKIKPIGGDKVVCPKCSGKLKRVCKSPRKYICKNILCRFKHIGKLSNIKEKQNV